MRLKEPLPVSLVTLRAAVSITLCNYEGDESTVETVAAGDLVGCYPYCLDGDAAPVTIRADKPCTVYVVDGQQLNQHLLQSKETAQVALQFLNYRFAQLHQHRRQYYFTHQSEDE